MCITFAWCILFLLPSIFYILIFPIPRPVVPIPFLNTSHVDLNTSSQFLLPTPNISRSSFRCAESVPSYYDAERTVFNVPDHMRHTCLFSNLYYDLQTRRIFFLIEDENDTMPELPPMSIMGFPNALSAPMAFPPNTIAEARRSTLFLQNTTTLLTFAPILGMVSRTYEVHHGHTLFDGVLSHWYAMKRMNISNKEIARRDMLIQFHDNKGIAPMDDRFRLLSSLPFLYGNHETFQGIANLDSKYFTPLIIPQHNESKHTIIRIERAIFGLAGFGWASAPQTQEWRGQKMRLFRQHAFAKMNLTEVREISTINLLIIDRVPNTRLSNGKVVNYFARWIFDDAAAFTQLAIDLQGKVNITRVTLEDTTLEYQMQLVQSASIIMTLEGCAMENVPFFRDHTALIALQYNRRWEHYYYISARHFVEYAQFNHVKMVSTWIDPGTIPIQNTGGNYGVHLYYDLMLRAIQDAIEIQSNPLETCNGTNRCGSLISYTHDNGTFSMFY